MPYEFLKGHGTENDFVLLPDLDGTVHGELDRADRVRALCDRRAGIGGDGVLRVVVRSDATPMPSGSWTTATPTARFSEMCGNGIRLFVRYLVDEGLADGSRADPRSTPATASRCSPSTAT